MNNQTRKYIWLAFVYGVGLLGAYTIARDASFEVPHYIAGFFIFVSGQVSAHFAVKVERHFKKEKPASSQPVEIVAR